MDTQIEALVMNLGFKPREDEISAIEKLTASLENHVTEESKFLKVYGEAIAKHDSSLVQFILKLILADEETHHSVLRRVVAALNADLIWRKDGNQMPTLGAMDTVEKKRLRDLTDEFIAEEKHGIAQSKSLMKMSENCYGGLLTMLLGTMVHDSQKHITMLRFIRRQLK